MATKIVNNGKQAKLLKFPLLPCHLSIDRRIFLYPEISTHFSCPSYFIFRPPPQEEEVNLQRRARKIKSGKGGLSPWQMGKSFCFFRLGRRGMEKSGKGGYVVGSQEKPRRRRAHKTTFRGNQRGVGWAEKQGRKSGRTHYKFHYFEQRT